MADNFHFDITGVSLEKALDIAFWHHHDFVGWKDEGKAEIGATRRLILFWTGHPDMTPVHTPMGLDSAVPFVKEWLTAVNYGPEPDHDGDNQKGWRIYNEAWGHVGEMWQAFVAIEPVWLMYGK